MATEESHMHSRVDVSHTTSTSAGKGYRMMMMMMMMMMCYSKWDATLDSVVLAMIVMNIGGSLLIVLFISIL
jgi:hypothetical protein